MEEILVPLFLFAAVPATVWIVSHYRYKHAREAATVLSTMVDKGDAVTPEVIRSLGVRGRPRHADLRTGLVLVAIALATFFFAGLIPDEEGQIVMTGVGMFPFLIGAVFIGLWVFLTRKDPA